MDQENPKCRIEKFVSQGLCNKIEKWFPCSNMVLLNSESFSSLKEPPSEGKSHDEEVKRWAKKATNYLKEKDSDSVIYTTGKLPSHKKDDDALKTAIKEALKELSGEDEPYFLAVKCREAGKGYIIHILVIANEHILYLFEIKQLDDTLREIFKKTFTEEPSHETSNGEGGTTPNSDESHEKKKNTPLHDEQEQTNPEKSNGKDTQAKLAQNGDGDKDKIDLLSSTKKHLFSAWLFSKKGLCIASLLYLMMTLPWIGYVFLIMDNTIQIALPDKLSDTKVWAYDNEGQPCATQKLSRDDKRYIIKCGILPAQWIAKTIRISGHKIILLSSLKEDNGHYQVTENDLKPLTEWPLVFTNNPKLPFEINTQVEFFESEQDCKNNQKSLDWRTYQSSVEPLTMQAPWAKIRSGDEDLSYCAEGKEQLYMQQDFRLAFSFKSNQFEGKRKIVVIAPSMQLAANGIGRIIQDTLKKWLFDLKKNHTSIPLSILLIDTNEEINTLIRSEDLNELPNEGKNSITAKVNGIKFASDSYRSVYELEQLDLALEGKDFDQVLYLTDGESYSGSSTLSSSLKMALGIPRYWMSHGISLSVLTVGECGFWENEMSEAKCQTLDSQYKKIAQWRFENSLKKLLSKY
ncbi:hypothetical protein PN36_03995 [Candidatus Thiomargarita nelsonii]|uniref:Uncharacterized protein n=1 Tax=Candidatus Thiomargarita nelsonii TaxID=1003181 RepID=A0A0A6PB88_9GAMM|nr:hypothetical protein PN36_03995 [Candidatus Thiomargarita nelsonii]